MLKWGNYNIIHNNGQNYEELNYGDNDENWKKEFNPIDKMRYYLY